MGRGEIHWAQDSHESPLAARPLYKIEIPDWGTLFIKGPTDPAFLQQERCDCGKTSCIGTGRTIPMHKGDERIIVKLNASYWVHIPNSDIRRVVEEAVKAFETPVDQRPPAG